MTDGKIGSRSSLRSMFQFCEYCWSENKAHKGDGMWGYDNWAINNREQDGDRCHDGRINVCKQTSADKVGHTGGGLLIGTSCGGSQPGGSAANLWKGLSRREGKTFTCPDNGSDEQEVLDIDWDDVFHIFVRLV